MSVLAVLGRLAVDIRHAIVGGDVPAVSRATWIELAEVDPADS